MAYKPTHLSDDLIRRLDEDTGRAIASVDDGHATKATSGLSLTAELDEDGRTVVTFAHKAGSTQKGTFTPSRQPRLPLEPFDAAADAELGERERARR